MDPESIEFWEWFYEPANKGPSMSAEQRQRAIEERWHPDLVLVQAPEMPGTAGEFHGYEGLENFDDQGDRIVATGRFRGKAKSGAELDGLRARLRHEGRQGRAAREQARPGALDSRLELNRPDRGGARCT